MSDTENGLEKLATALAKAQGEIKNAKEDSTNPHFNSKYADLASMWDACRDALSKNGLCVTQFMEVVTHSGDGMQPQTTQMVLVTRLLHSSGQFIDGRTLIQPLVTTRKDKEDKTISVEVRNDPQGLGSQLTYLRRYALAAIVGIATEDDDAESTTANGERVSTKTGEVLPKREDASNPATEKQVGWITRNFKAIGWTEEDLWKAIEPINNAATKLTELKSSEASKLIDQMMKIGKEQGNERQ
jgi:hypothetical protein